MSLYEEESTETPPDASEIARWLESPTEEDLSEIEALSTICETQVEEEIVTPWSDIRWMIGHVDTMPEYLQTDLLVCLREKHVEFVKLEKDGQLTGRGPPIWSVEGLSNKGNIKMDYPGKEEEEEDDDEDLDFEIEIPEEGKKMSISFHRPFAPEDDKSSDEDKMGTEKKQSTSTWDKFKSQVPKVEERQEVIRPALRSLQKNEDIFTDRNNGLSFITANPKLGILAFANVSRNTDVALYTHPSMELLAEIHNVAVLELLEMRILSDRLLLTLSGQPDFKMFLWDWVKGESLKEYQIEPFDILAYKLRYYPTNNFLMVMVNDNEVVILAVEKIMNSWKINQEFYLDDSKYRTVAWHSNHTIYFGYDGSIQKFVRRKHIMREPIELFDAVDILDMYICKDVLCMACSDKTIKIINLKQENLEVNRVIECYEDVKSINVSMNQKYFYLLDKSGGVYSFPMSADSSSSLNPINATHRGAVTGACALCLKEDCVALLCSDGTVDIINAESGSTVLQLDIPDRVTAVIASESEETLIVGTVTGHVGVFHITESAFKEGETVSRLVFQMRVCKGPITLMKFDNKGHQFCVLEKSSSQILFYLGQSEDKFQYIGSSEQPRVILDVQAIWYQDNSRYFILTTSETNESVTDRILEIDVSKNGRCKRYYFRLFVHVTAVTVEESGNYIIGSSAQGHEFVVWEIFINNFGRHQCRIMNRFETTHALSITQIDLLDGFLYSSSKDGQVKCHDIRAYLGSEGEYKQIFLNQNIPLNSPFAGGTVKMLIEKEKKWVLVLGCSGSCFLYMLRTSEPVMVKDGEVLLITSRTRLVDSEHLEDMPTLREWKFIERTRNEEELLADEGEETKRFLSIKEEIEMELKNLIAKGEKMLQENQNMPEAFRLELAEFELDMDEQQKIASEGQRKVDILRDEIIFENVKYLYLREIMKAQCFDTLKVIGRAIKGVLKNISVSNYPMYEENTQDELKYNMAASLREQELRVNDLLSQLTKELKVQQKSPTSRDKAKDTEEHTEVSEDLQTTEDGTKEAETEDNSQFEASTGEVPIRHPGSLSHNYVPWNPLMYRQVDTLVTHQFNIQEILLRRTLQDLKRFFNAQFTSVYDQKVYLMKIMREKNTRIKYLTDILGITVNMIPLVWTTDEVPENILIVKEEDIKVEKWVSPQERLRLEKLRKEELRRKLAAQDDFRERALKKMMGGVLEVRPEDILNRRISMPLFMTEKDPSEYTDEEKRLAEEYYQAVRALEDEQAKLREDLTNECNKLVDDVLNMANNFDDQVVKLYQLKIQVDKCIKMEELMIIRMQVKKHQEEMFAAKESNLQKDLERLQKGKLFSHIKMTDSKALLDDVLNKLEKTKKTDAILDKSFRKDFVDVRQFVETLYKLFKKRPKLIVHQSSDENLEERIRVKTLRTSSDMGAEMWLKELDDPVHKPQFIDMKIWERLCHARRVKANNELALRTLQKEIVDFEENYRVKVVEDALIRERIEETFRKLSDNYKARINNANNLKLQLVMKQGQIEVGPQQHKLDFKGALLMNRNLIEELNNGILELGNRKLQIMNASKDFRKGILQLEWEHQRMLMKAEDHLMKLREIEFYRVDKEIRVYLHKADAKDQKDPMVVLEQAQEAQVEFHKRELKIFHNLMRELQADIERRRKQHLEYDEEISMLQKDIKDRQELLDMSRKTDVRVQYKRRFHNIRKRTRLKEISSIQQGQIQILKQELQRLQNKNYPTLC